MASRTPKTSGTGWDLEFLLGVKDSPSTTADIELYKSVSDGAGLSDNTSSAAGNMTVDSGVTVGTLTWNGHTVPRWTPTFSGGNKIVRFGTNKPNTGPGSGKCTYIALVDNLATPSTSRGMFKIGASSAILAFDGSGHLQAKYQGSALITGSRTFSAGETGLIAFTNDKTGASNAQKLYWCAAGGSISQDAQATASGETFGGDVAYWGANEDLGLTWLNPYILCACIKDSFASDGARETFLQAVADDPYGSTLFTGGSGGALLAYNARRRQ